MKNMHSNQTLSLWENRGGLYVSPSIEIIHQVYNEGLMSTLSTSDGTGEITDPNDVFSKPGGEWGNSWDEPVKNNDNW